jgi:hypothetical protein
MKCYYESKREFAPRRKRWKVISTIIVRWTEPQEKRDSY